MSKIISKIIPREGKFATKEMYGIKFLKKLSNGTEDYGLKLPIVLSDEEVNELRKQLTRKYGEGAYSSYPAGKFMIFCPDVSRSSIASIFIFVEKDLTELYTSFTYQRSKQKTSWDRFVGKLLRHACLVYIDEILEETLVGEKLKEYWIKRDGITMEDAKARLRKITS
jgi:hypothetical protein